jgi:peptide/nickel transport system substrate-binding protein
VAASSSTTITTAWPSDITTLDPANLSTAEDHELARNIYQPLESPAFTVQSDGSLKFDGAQVKPDLAQSWTLGADSITYHLRPGVKFAGTSDVMTAEDVKWSLDRIWSTPGVGDFKANGLQNPSDIHIVNNDTVTIDFTTANGKPTPVTPTLMAIFDQPYTSIIDENQVKPHETASDPTGATWLRTHAAGTGPYYIAQRDPGTSF